MTVHQIRLPEGHLKELYKATGNVTSTDCFIDVIFWPVSGESIHVCYSLHFTNSSS